MMVEVVTKGKKNLKYVYCPYCNSHISFFKKDTYKNLTEVFGKISCSEYIKCPLCNTDFAVSHDGIWKEGVVDA